MSAHAFYEEIEKLFSNVASLKVLSVGDWVLDVYINGDIERISREAPIPVLRWKSQRSLPGGACNVAVNLASLGAKVTALGVVGKDAIADELLGLLRGAKVSVQAISDTRRHTTVKTRFMGGAQQMFRADRDQRVPLGNDIKRKILSKAEALIKKSDIVIISDYGNGVLDGGVCEKLIELAHKNGKRVLIDPRARDFSRYAGADLLTPNLGELSNGAGLELDADTPPVEIVKLARKICRRHKIKAIMATRGSQGLSYITPEKFWHLPAKAQKVFDVTGAGDCVAAAALLGMAFDLAPEVIARLANTAGALAVQTLGVAVLTRADLLNQIAAGETVAGKVMTQAQAAVAARAWRAAGLKLGFTNGCFDIIHAGHVSQFEFAAQQCDRLIVGINSDASVRNLKGKDRPLQSEAARAHVVAAMSMVAAAVIFDKPKPLELIKQLKPDIYAKGAEYKAQDKKTGKTAEMPEAKLVKSLGGKVLFAPMLDGFSTSLIIKKMAK